MSSLIIIIIDILWRWEFQAMTKKKSYIEITYIKCFSVESMILFHYSFPHTSVKKWSLKHVNFCSRRILDDSNLLFNSDTFSTVQFNIQYCKITQIAISCIVMRKSVAHEGLYIFPTNNNGKIRCSCAICLLLPN